MLKLTQTKSVQNLGIIIDKNFTFLSHRSAVYSFCHSKDLGHIRCHLDPNSEKLYAHNLVSSCLDYSNFHLSGIADSDLTKLQVFRIH